MVKHLIDVVIPVFNAARTIRSAIESIQRQTLGEIRIIIVDDGSTDETPRIIREITAGDLRLQTIRQPNSGIVDALNAGLAQCAGEFIARHDADDLACPDRFERQVAYLKSHPDCVAVSGGARHIDEESRFIGVISRLRSPETADAAWAPAIEPYLIHPFLMARRSVVHQVGGYRHVVHAEDSDLYWRMQEIGRLHNMAVVLGDYRMHPASISAHSLINGRIMALSSQLAALSALRRRAGRPDVAFPKEARSRYLAAGSLASVFALGCEGLVQAEVDHLAIALSGKLLEITSYRPYDLELADCRFIRSAVRRHAAGLTAANRAALARSCAAAAARLAHKGLFREAAALASPEQRFATLWRLGLRLALPPSVRGRLRRAIRGETTVELK